jgi:hypothetical protein
MMSAANTDRSGSPEDLRDLGIRHKFDLFVHEPHVALT